ncbi:MAG: bifunctional folylpolyglutamate synthase/dihydrofolate synthase [Lactobacillus sp.]|jgi:dihydrofolate synthase/folylpolyglutamate synthase|nr:bifunctional folylpolyglutamate synthase/dihydrofolate synthase [Lactobacillus sp.]
METYEEAVKYIHARPKKHRTASLNNMHQILKAMGDPQQGLKGIHVTGTNGKGSVTQMLTQLIVSEGFKTGTFISPFITRFNERIQINNQPISDADLLYWTNQVVAASDRLQAEDPDFTLLEFELVTTIMFCYFNAQQVDVAVIEVGIGGAHDKTNVFTPLLSVITTVGLDHVQLIGPTLADIATEKSGIIKAKRPVVVGAVKPEVLAILTTKAQQTASPLLRYGRDFSVTNVTTNPDFTQSFDYHTPDAHFKKIVINNIAPFEVDNTAVALKAFQLFTEMMQRPFDLATVKAVLAQYQLIGRAELISREPFIMLDGAHNPQAIQRLLETLQQDFAQVPIRLVAAFMKDKDIATILKLLHKQPNLELYLTTLDMPRAAKEADLKSYMAPGDKYFEPWQQSFLEAYHNTSADELILIAGSIYLMSEARRYLTQGED